MLQLNDCGGRRDKVALANRRILELAVRVDSSFGLVEIE
jgi:hypothetical protein